jgi:hypothetical protein
LFSSRFEISTSFLVTRGAMPVVNTFIVSPLAQHRREMIVRCKA